MNLSKLKCCVIDFGVFSFFAQKLAEAFKEVFLYIPYESPFPLPDREMIGKGIPGITLIDEPDDHEGEIDLYVFLDYGFSGRQRALRKKGKRVFGAGESEVYEMDREKAMKLLARSGLPVPPNKIVTGVDALREALKSEKELKWIKLPTKARGVMETWKWQGYEKSCRKLDKLGYDLGVIRDTTRFMICGNIPGVEIGVEKFLSNGNYADVGVAGIEIKGDGYLGHLQKMSDMPPFLKRVDDALQPEWKKMKVCAHISSEVRAGKNRLPYFGDFCQRQGSPPGEVICNAYKNLPELIYAAAGGEELKPEPAGEWLAEICVYSTVAKEEPLAVTFPEKQAGNLKFRRLCKVGKQFFVLQDKLAGDRVCGAVGVADTPEEAEFIATEAAEALECEGKDYSKTAFEDVEDVIEEAKGYGLFKQF